MIKISGLVITYNEERNIERCIKSMLPVCDEIVVVDSGSADNTVSIANSMGVRTVYNPFRWPYRAKKSCYRSRQIRLCIKP